MATYTPFLVTISSVSGPLFEGEVISLTVPGVSGDMTILKGHEPLISLLRSGSVVLTMENNEKKTFDHEKGVLEVTTDQVTVLV